METWGGEIMTKGGYRTLSESCSVSNQQNQDIKETVVSSWGKNYKNFSSSVVMSSNTVGNIKTRSPSKGWHHHFNLKCSLEIVYVRTNDRQTREETNCPSLTKNWTQGPRTRFSLSFQTYLLLIIKPHQLSPECPTAFHRLHQDITFLSCYCSLIITATLRKNPMSGTWLRMGHLNIWLIWAFILPSQKLSSSTTYSPILTAWFTLICHFQGHDWTVMFDIRVLAGLLSYKGTYTQDRKFVGNPKQPTVWLFGKWVDAICRWNMVSESCIVIVSFTVLFLSLQYWQRSER